MTSIRGRHSHHVAPDPGSSNMQLENHAHAFATGVAIAAVAFQANMVAMETRRGQQAQAKLHEIEHHSRVHIELLQRTCDAQIKQVMDAGYDAQQRFQHLLREYEARETLMGALQLEIDEAKHAALLVQTASDLLKTQASCFTPAEEAWHQAWQSRSKKTTRCDDVMADLTLLAGFEMSRSTYETFRPFLRLPDYDHAMKMRKDHVMYLDYKPGWNPNAFDVAAKLHCSNITVTTVDGTRVRRDIQVKGSNALVGVQYPPDVRRWPTEPDPIPGEFKDVQEYVNLARGNPTLLAHDLVTIAVHSITTHPANFMPIAFFPEPIFGYTTNHSALLMMETARRVWLADIISVGECDDSCTVQVSSGLMLNTPTEALMGLFPHWIGVNVPEFKYWAPIIAIGSRADVAIAVNTRIQEPEPAHGHKDDDLVQYQTHQAKEAMISARIQKDSAATLVRVQSWLSVNPGPTPDDHDTLEGRQDYHMAESTITTCCSHPACKDRSTCPINIPCAHRSCASGVVSVHAVHTCVGCDRPMHPWCGTVVEPGFDVSVCSSCQTNQETFTATSSTDIPPPPKCPKDLKYLAETIWSFYGEVLHGQRNLRKGTGATTRQLLVTVHEDMTRTVAMLSELQAVEKALNAANIATPSVLASFKDMYTINAFRDQNSTAAHSLLSIATMEALVRARSPHCHALLLYILIGFYLFEPWINPTFTEPYYVSAFLWTAKNLLDKLERYVKLHKFDPNLFLLSGTTRRTLDSMCHSGQVHFLKGWRMHKQGVLELDARWSQLALRLVNTKPLEGYHGVTRSDGNDINKSIAEWLCTTNRRTLTLAVRTALAQRYGFNLPQPKNRKKIHEHRSLFMRPVPTILHDLIGIAATLDVGDLTTGGVKSQPCPTGPFLTYKSLHDAMVLGCQRGNVNAVAIYTALAPQSAAALDAEPNFKYKTALHAVKDCVWPKAFVSHIVMCDENPARVMEPCGADGLAPFLNLDDIQTHGATDVDNIWKDGVGSAQTQASKLSRQVAIDKFKRLRRLVEHLRKHGPLALPPKHNQGVVMCRTCDGHYIGVMSYLSNANPKDWFSKDRGPRFWVSILRDARTLPPGHNCTWGTIVLVSISGGVIAVGRVHRFEGDTTTSCKIKCRMDTKQLYLVELCHEILSTNTQKKFAPSGCYFTAKNKEILEVPMRVQPATNGESACVLDECDWAPLVQLYGKFVDHSSLFAIDGLVRPVATPEENDDANDPMLAKCCRCGSGWSFDQTGKMTRCGGVCARWFHQGCVDAPATPGPPCPDDWECARCTGDDDAICHFCDKEWYNDMLLLHDNSRNPYYTGFTLQCNGCNRWWHQVCHDPPITDEYVQLAHDGTVKKKTKSKDWMCAGCVEAQHSRIQDPTRVYSHALRDAMDAPTDVDLQRDVVDAPTDVDLLHAPKAVDIGYQLPRAALPSPTTIAATNASTPTPPDAPKEPAEPTPWVCSKCGITMAPHEDCCSCMGCSQCTSGCNLPRRLVGIVVIEECGKLLRQRGTIARAGMVPWDGVRTAENRTNREKIVSSFFKPSAAQPIHTSHRKTSRAACVPDDAASYVPPPPPSDHAQPSHSHSHWVCHKCNITMPPAVTNCACTGCDTCGTGCGLPRKQCEGPSSNKRQRRSTNHS